MESKLEIINGQRITGNGKQIRKTKKHRSVKNLSVMK